MGYDCARGGRCENLVLAVLLSLVALVLTIGWFVGVLLIFSLLLAIICIVTMQVKVSDNKLIESKPGCIARALEIVGNKWTALIAKELSTGCARFSSLQVALPGISPRTLSQRLDCMEQEELITKRIFAEVPPRVEYTLTSKGQDLLPILKSMAWWGEKYSK